MGLIQRIIEARGIPTVSISLMRNFTVETRPPRAVFLKWPMGHPLGLPGRKDIQRKVLRSTLETLVEATEPGRIVDLPYRWKRFEDFL